MFLRAIGIGFASAVVRMKAFRISIAINREGAVFDYDPFAFKGNYAFDDILISDVFFRRTVV